MRNDLTFILLLALCFSLLSPSYGRKKNVKAIGPIQISGLSLIDHNLSHLTKIEEKYDLNDDVLRFNAGYENHPDLGLVSGLPCENCFELIGERSERTRSYRYFGTEWSKVLIQASSEPINYKNSQGDWLLLPKGLQKVKAKTYALWSPEQTILVNVGQGYLQINTKAHTLRFNADLQLYFKDANGKLSHIGKADWSRYTVGDEGIKLIDAWPGIDIEMIVYRGRVATHYVIKEAMPQYAGGALLVRDRLQLPSSLTLSEAEEAGKAFQISDAEGIEQYSISGAVGFVQQNAFNTAQVLPYHKTDDHQLDLLIPGVVLNLSSSEYPYLIDPLFSSSRALAANTMGTKNGGPNDPCIYVNDVPVPPKVSITDLKFTFGYQLAFYSYPTLSASKVAFAVRVDGSSRSCITQKYSCVDSTNNIPVNQCYTSSPISINTNLRSCYPEPQCATYDLPVALDFYRTEGPVADCNNLSIAWNYLPFEVFIEGRTLELRREISSSIAGNHGCAGTPFDLMAYGQNGVPPYTYYWLPDGQTTQTITVNPNVSTHYEVTITDQCDNQVQSDIDVAIDQPSFSSEERTICNAELPFVWNGIEIEQSGNYTYTTTNAKGCDSTVTLQVSLTPVSRDTTEIRGCSTIEYKGKTYHEEAIVIDTFTAINGCDSLHRFVYLRVVDPKVWFPSAFTPNQDGLNDVWGARVSGPVPSEYGLKVYNRWGQIVFVSFKSSDSWDGTIDGQPADQGTYFYHLHARCQDGLNLDDKGTFELIR